MSTIEQLDAVVRESLVSLAAELGGGSWKGQREREVVSLFCFGHLLPRCKPGQVLHDPTQLSIEVAVPQVDRQRSWTGKQSNKPQVCKDIVIWPRPRMVCWDESGEPTVRPLSVLEWKHNEAEVSERDIAWLCEFSASDSEFVGYAVSTRRPARGFVLSCARAHLGRQVPWLQID